MFVTLHVQGELRGCIGTTEGDEPLGDATVRCAASAALRDPRFPAMRSEELGELNIEISVLSPLAPIRPEEIEVGRHGLVVSDENHRGLLLPQVAPEHGLNREQFLAETCRKARLPQDARAMDIGANPRVHLRSIFGREAGRSQLAAIYEAVQKAQRRRSQTFRRGDVGNYSSST